MKQYMDPDSIILSDGWRNYMGCKKTFNGHYVVNHNVEFKNKQTGTHINTIEGNWSSIMSKFLRDSEPAC